MTLPDPVLVLLLAEGHSRAVAERGLPGLVTAWEEAVERIASGYGGGLEDYLRELATRQLIHEVWDVARPDQQDAVIARLTAADRRARNVLVPLARCVRGDQAAADHGWQGTTHWWLFSRPAAAGERLMAEWSDAGGPAGDP